MSRQVRTIFLVQKRFLLLGVTPKVFKKDDNKEFRLVQNLTIGEANFNRFMRLRNQLVNAAENFAREENSTSVLIDTMSKDMDEQIKLAHRVVDVVDRANRKICVTLLRYNVDKPESCHAQVRLFARKKEDEKFQQCNHVNNELEEFFYLLDVMKSVNDKVITNQPFCKVFQKIVSSVYSLSQIFFSSQDELEHLR